MFSGVTLEYFLGSRSILDIKAKKKKPADHGKFSMDSWTPKLRSSRAEPKWQLRATVGQNRSSVQMASAYHVGAAVLALDERSSSCHWKKFSRVDKKKGHSCITLDKNPYVCRIEFFPPKINVRF